ncbi:hypothetical protein DSCW_18690 [Desulfosarcina widdelii]|uniref:DUF2333 domain-containing protein n=1 Tax=Desulfosarcina widdelii TaxID=947919 RepID=A0A5K7YXE6_9BACT|nr:DUF2333 family protein [Desulfosarcina widdelii]BBO74452.1 hypothetical protein DSCW_18690 [Desulfosarcina widdelii]
MGNEAKGFEFRKFATPRIIGGIVIAIVVLWALILIFGSSDVPSSRQTDSEHASPTVATGHEAESEAPAVHEAAASHETGTQPESQAAGHGETSGKTAAVHQTTDSQAHQATASHDTAPAGETKVHSQTTAAAERHETAANSHAASGAAAESHETANGHPAPVHTATHKPQPKGVAFVEASIKPLQYELEERWWGWRPNDIINVTDNVNNFQMGVLEVTRRTTVALAERISRTGTTDSFDENLEQAMNWFMVKATSYWFPSAESKYREGLEELEAYLEKLKAGKATFYTRTDNLIPLLASFEDLLGSCDENLVKRINEDGSPVSFFAADDYFFYTQGVASAMGTVLEAVHHDFLLTLESRHGTELLHHAIVSCQQAAELDPWIILDRDLSSIFANHRANIAAPVSHARFYLGQLIKTLST